MSFMSRVADPRILAILQAEVAMLSMNSSTNSRTAYISLGQQLGIKRSRELWNEIKRVCSSKHEYEYKDNEVHR